MPRPGPARTGIVVKFTEPGLATVNQRAAEDYDGNRSLFIRECIAYALVHMPRPKRG